MRASGPGDSPRAAAARASGSDVSAAATVVSCSASLARPGLLRTDIVGYPTFADFNIYGYFWKYGLVVVVCLS